MRGCGGASRAAAPSAYFVSWMRLTRLLQLRRVRELRVDRLHRVDERLPVVERR